jgi:hypothetical protein
MEKKMKTLLLAISLLLTTQTFAKRYCGTNFTWKGVTVIEDGKYNPSFVTFELASDDVMDYLEEHYDECVCVDGDIKRVQGGEVDEFEFKKIRSLRKCHSFDLILRNK